MFEQILKNNRYHYLVHPLTDTKNLSNSIKNNKDISFEKWKYDDVYFKNINIDCSYLLINRYKKDRYTLSIFSSILSENINNYNNNSNQEKNSEIDKSWCILKKKATINEIENYLKSEFYNDYKNHWLTRKDSSTKYDTNILNKNFTEYWLKCIVTNPFDL